MRLLLVEDDPLQIGAFCEEVRQEFDPIEVDVIRTEYEFRQALDRIVERPPDIIILDVMMRWTKPSPDQPPRPQDVKDGGPIARGCRCEKLLAERGFKVPTILYTILEKKDLERELPNREWVLQIRKDASLDPLFKRIRELTAPRPG